MNEEQGRTDQNHFELVPLSNEQHLVTPIAKFTTELPFFYLTKQKKLLEQDIRYEGVDAAGNPIRWEVMPNRNRRIGVPAIEAHAIWTRLVKPCMEIHRRPDGAVPEILPLGGIRECLRIVGWKEGGWEARGLLQGLMQTGQATCDVDFFLPTGAINADGRPLLRPIKGIFNRFSIWKIGSKHVSEEDLAAGNFKFDFDLDDTLYIQLHSLERDIQRNQDQRYLDNQYIFSVGATARRWYELMAAKIFGVVKNNGNYCEIRYSWYIKHHHTLMRLSTRARVVSQMNRVVSDHIDSGFVTKVEYRAMRDEQGQADFIIRYYPGPEAKQSVKRVLAFINTSTWPLLVERRREKAKSRKQKNETNADAEILSAQTGDTETGAIQLPSTGSDAILLPAPQPASVIQTEAEAQVDETLLAVLTQRGGIGEKKSRALLSNLKPDQQVIDQLEWGEHQVRTNPSKFTNPAGFYIHLIEENLPVPATFETSRKRANRLEEEQRRREVERLEREYETYKRAELDRYITEHPHQFGATKETTTKEVIERYGHFAPTMAMVESLATIEARFEIAKKVTMLSFEEFIKADKAERANAVVQVAPQPTTGTDLNEPAEQAVAAEPSTQPVSGTDGNQEAGEVVTETEGQEELSSPQHQDVASEPAIDPVPPHTDSGTGLSASTSIEPPNSN